MIFKVTTKYAICAVTYLIDNGMGRVITAKEIADKRGIPSSYLPRILGKMAKAGIIDSFHGGRDRGYRMVRDPGDISLYEVLDIFEQWSNEGCLLSPGNRDCTCNVKYCWEAIEEKMFLPLKEITVRDVCEADTEAAVKELLTG